MSKITEENMTLTPDESLLDIDDIRTQVAKIIEDCKIVGSSADNNIAATSNDNN